MKIIRIKDATHILGESQGYTPMPVRRSHELFDEGRLPVVAGAFELSPEEIEALKAGKPLIIQILGHAWPPLIVKVGDE